MSRYSRDEVLIQGLELASSPTVIKHDMPGGTIEPSAYSIKWLQNALDMFHRKYPFSTDVTNVSMYLGVNTYDLVLSSDHSIYLPTDYILDIRHGLLGEINNQKFRVERRGFQTWLQASQFNNNTSVRRPFTYTTVNNRIKIAPQVSEALSLTLWYYALPAALEAEDQVPFPDEWSLIEFIRLKALEWTRSIEIGTAQAYLTKELGRLRASGLLHETEYDVFPLENNQVLIEGVGGDVRNAWMGYPTLPGI